MSDCLGKAPEISSTQLCGVWRESCASPFLDGMTRRMEYSNCFKPLLSCFSSGARSVTLIPALLTEVQYWTNVEENIFSIRKFCKLYLKVLKFDSCIYFVCPNQFLKIVCNCQPERQIHVLYSCMPLGSLSQILFVEF